MKTYRVPVAVHLNSQVVDVDVEAESEADAVEAANGSIYRGEFDYEIEKNVSIEWLDPWNHDIEILEDNSEEEDHGK